MDLKPLAPEAVAKALEKAERYRLLNEPEGAESICLDILRIEPGHQAALVTLLLARTDQFASGGTAARAREILPALRDEYDRTYYAGLICERRARALLHRGGPGSSSMAYEGFREAMGWYEKAEALRPAGNDDAVLRWNTCVRILARHPHLRPAAEERAELPLE